MTIIAHSDTSMMDGMEMMGGTGMMGGMGMMWLWMALGLVLFLAVLVLLVIGIVKLSTRQRDQADSVSGEARRAQQILGERYARGEIETDEYRQRMSALSEKV